MTWWHFKGALLPIGHTLTSAGGQASLWVNTLLPTPLIFMHSNFVAYVWVIHSYFSRSVGIIFFFQILKNIKITFLVIISVWKRFISTFMYTSFLISHTGENKKLVQGNSTYVLPFLFWITRPRVCYPKENATLTHIF